jgi:hypothetical protein
LKSRLPPDKDGHKLWLMKLRLDLLEHLTADDIRKAAENSVHRYKPEPLFNKTGAGYLRPATPQEREAEIARCEATTAKLKKRLKESQNRRPS